MTSVDFLTSTQVAQLLSVHPETVRRRVRDGHIKASLFEGTWVFDRNHIEEYAKTFQKRKQEEREPQRPKCDVCKTAPVHIHWTFCGEADYCWSCFNERIKSLPRWS